MPAAGANRGYAKTVLPGASRNPSIAAQHPSLPPAAQGGGGPPILAAQQPAHYSYPSHFSAQAPSSGSFSPAGIPQITAQQQAAQRQASLQQQNQKILASYLHGSSQPFSFLTKLPAFASKSVD